jgi:glycosyltransferase involved in cell wall biosynthesis
LNKGSLQEYYPYAILAPSSLLNLRGVEHWILEVTSRIKGITIITFFKDLHYDVRDLDELSKRLAVVRTWFAGRNVRWYELRVLSYENMWRKIPEPVIKFIKSRGLVIPLSSKLLMLRGKIVYIVCGDPFQAILLALIAIIVGARKIILGFHARPSYKVFTCVKPIFTVLSKLKILKGIHTVNIVDALTLRKILIRTPIWWVPNGVDCRRFKQSTKRSDKFQVLFVGAVSEDKGADTFVEIAKIVKRTFNDVEFVIVSAGGSLRRLIEDAHNQGIVHYLGFIPDALLPKLYAESHITVFPSREEAFGLVSLEAQASGTPVIATDLPAFRQSVINGVTGILIKPYTPQAFADAIIKMRDIWLNDRLRYMQMCRAARENAEKYCWERIVRIYYEKFFK